MLIISDASIKYWGPCVGKKNRDSIAKLGIREHINVLKSKKAKSAKMTFTKNVSRCKSSSLANGQHGGTFLHQKDGGGGGYPQQGSFRVGQGNLGLPDSK